MSTQDLCVALAALLILDLIGWRLVSRSRVTLRLALRVASFALYTWLVMTANLSPLKPVANQVSSALQFVTVIFLIIWWLLAARVLTALLGALLHSRSEGGGRLLQEVLGALIFMIATVAAAAYVLELPVKGLLATSGALAIIVGLALQSTLSDVFSGIVLNATRPYQLGDWIQVDGMEGTVTDIDWRATVLVNGMGTTVVIPNSIAAKTKIQNLSRPEDRHGVSVSISLPLKFRPEWVQESLEHALSGYREFIADPKPQVMLKSITEGLLEYELSGFIRSSSGKIAARNRLFDLAYRHLRASGIDPGAAVSIESAEQVVAILNDVRIFSGANSEGRKRLASHVNARCLQIGDYLLKENEISEHLLIIASGVVSVQLKTGDTWVEIARMSPGEVLGEQGVIDNAPNGAQFIAVTPVKVFQLHRDDVSACMNEQLYLRESLSRLRHVRQEHARSVLLQKKPALHKGGFLDWLKSR